MSKQKRRYRKPEAKKQEKMDFLTRATSGKLPDLACRQCSSCHGCR